MEAFLNFADRELSKVLQVNESTTLKEIVNLILQENGSQLNYQTDFVLRNALGYVDGSQISKFETPVSQYLLGSYRIAFDLRTHLQWRQVTEAVRGEVGPQSNFVGRQEAGIRPFDRVPDQSSFVGGYPGGNHQEEFVPQEPGGIFGGDSISSISHIRPNQNAKEEISEFKTFNGLLHNYLPVMKSRSYRTYPPYNELLKMTQSELQCVRDFSIENHLGRIDFLDPVDLTYANFDIDVRIGRDEVEVYPIDAVGQAERPLIGAKLNVPAQVTLVSISRIEGESYEQALYRWGTRLERSGGYLESLDLNSGRLIYKVFSF